MLRSLYDRAMSLAASRHATPWLAVAAFAEASFFPVPPDIMLAPMVLARPQRAWSLAAVCTLASVAGGALGYAIGFFLAPLALKLLALLGHPGGLETFRAWYADNGFVLILLKGLTPVPYKLVTISSGLASFSFGLFMLASVITRGARFFLVAGLLRYFGPPVREFVEKRLTLVTTAAAVLLVGGFVALHFVGGR
jgi:membrane protein YqaA with SNARE-associated domain